MKRHCRDHDPDEYPAAEHAAENVDLLDVSAVYFIEHLENEWKCSSFNLRIFVLNVENNVRILVLFLVIKVCLVRTLVLFQAYLRYKKDSYTTII